MKTLKVLTLVHSDFQFNGSSKMKYKDYSNKVHYLMPVRDWDLRD